MKIMTFLFLIGLMFRPAWGKDTVEFFSWLNQNKDNFIQCHPKRTGEHYRLCDNTLIDIKMLKSLFSKTPLELLDFLSKEKIKITIYCQNEGKGNFDKSCVKTDSNKLGQLHGKFLPEENTILLKSNATVGDLIHEYIHYLQFKNSNLIFGKRYKAERVEIQKELIKRMDEAIEKSKSTKLKSEVLKLIQVVKEASSQLMQFGYWQDLIDERSIFLLYINFGHEFGIAKEDLALARKNMGFICKREELPNSQCDKRND